MIKTIWGENMPATYTHAIYGEQVYLKLEDKTKQLIDKYRELYDIGLSGPDILFFYRFYKKNLVSEIGFGMHLLPARDFFTQARLIIQQSPNPEAALVYILGFINHFVLDSECHPVINQIVKEKGVNHSELESEWDASIMRMKSLDPIRTRVCDHIHCRKEYAEIIAPFFKVEANDLLESLRTMKLILNACVAPQNWYRNFVFWAMKKTGAYEKYYGLVFNREAREDLKEVIEGLQFSMENVVSVSVQLIEEYISTLTTTKALHERYDLNYE